MPTFAEAGSVAEDREAGSLTVSLGTFWGCPIAFSASPGAFLFRSWAGTWLEPVLATGPAAALLLAPCNLLPPVIAWTHSMGVSPQVPCIDHCIGQSVCVGCAVRAGLAGDMKYCVKSSGKASLPLMRSASMP